MAKARHQFVGVDPGRLRHFVAVQQDAGTRSASGDWAENWEALFNAHASIEPLSGSELYFANQVQDTLTHKVIMRYDSRLQPKHRLVEGSNVYHIERVIDLGDRQEWVELLCHREVG